MVQYKSNAPLYQLHFSELEEEAVQVLAFEGEESLSRLFEYRLELVSEDAGLDAKSILNKKATFVMTRGEEEPIKLHGIISHFEQRGRTPEYVFYYAVLVPKMWRLTLTFQNEIYQSMDMEKLIKKVMETSGFSGEDYEIALNESYPEQEYIVQYQETNFNFLNRRLEHYGIFYYFDQRESNEVIVFADANANLPNLVLDEELAYNADKDQLSEKETVREITCQEKVVTGLVRLKDYNYLHPGKQLLVESQIDADSPGLYYAFGDHFEDESQGEFLARVRNEELLSASKVFKGVSDCRPFRAGYKFKLDGHYREEWNDDYLLISLASRGTQGGLFSTLPSPKAALPTYENYFAAIPAAMAYRPPRRTPIPRIAGIMSAKIESGAGDEYAFIDDHGRYRAKMLFDMTDRTNGEATLPIRQVQAYSGSGYGMHFPNHADTELVWACVDGDVDRPVGLGTVPNPSNASPSTGGNKAQSVIRTAGLNEFTLDDTTGRENIYLHSTKDWTIDIVNDKNQKIGHDETANVGNDRSREVGHDETLSIKNNRSKTVDVDQSESIGKNKTINVGENHTESIGKNKQLSVGENHNESIGANMTLDIGKNLTESVGESMSLSVGKDQNEQIGKNKSVDVGENFSESAGKNFSCQSGKKMSFSAGDDFSISGDKKGVIEIADQLTIKCGSASITLKSNGDITIKGNKINVKGSSDVVIKGSKIAEN